MATGNVAQVTDDKKKPTKKATKAKAKPEPEKVETAAAPEPEAAPETNGEKQVEELAAPATAPEPTERAINEKIQKERQEQTQKFYGGQVEEAALTGGPRFIEASIFPDAYCPLCGQKLSGNSKTGFKQAFYVHPFTPSIALGKPCELKGKKLRAPVARMEIVEE